MTGQLELILFCFVIPVHIYAQLNTEWIKTFGGIDDDEGYSAHQTIDGGYIIIGYTCSFGAGNSDVWLIKTNSSGEATWEKTFGGLNVDEGVSVQQTTDGGYIITGLTASYSAGNLNAWLIRTDSNGDTLWTKTFGGSSTDVGRSVIQTLDNDFLVWDLLFLIRLLEMQISC